MKQLGSRHMVTESCELKINNCASIGRRFEFSGLHRIIVPDILGLGNRREKR